MSFESDFGGAKDQFQNMRIETLEENMSKILIVDDDEMMIMLARRILATKYEVVTATSGAEAIEIFEQERPRHGFIGFNDAGAGRVRVTQDITGKKRRSGTDNVYVGERGRRERNKGL